MAAEVDDEDAGEAENAAEGLGTGHALGAEGVGGQEHDDEGAARLDDGARHARAAREADIEQQILQDGLEDRELDGAGPVTASGHEGAAARDAHADGDGDQKARAGERDNGGDVGRGDAKEAVADLYAGEGRAPQQAREGAAEDEARRGGEESSLCGGGLRHVFGPIVGLVWVWAALKVSAGYAVAACCAETLPGLRVSAPR